MKITYEGDPMISGKMYEIAAMRAVTSEHFVATLREVKPKQPKPFTRADLNKDVRVKESGQIGKILDVNRDSGRVLVSGPFVRWWFEPEELERGRIVETWEPEP